MKSSILVFVLSIILSSCNQQPKPVVKTIETETKKSVVYENVSTASFSISGMTCKMGCAAAIEKNLNKLDGVQKAEVNFETQTAKVLFDPNFIGEQSLINAVSQTGSVYQVSNFQMGAESKKSCCEKEKKECTSEKNKTCCAKDKTNCCKKGEGKKCMKQA